MCDIMTGEIEGGDALLDHHNGLLVLAPHLDDIERTELARRAFGAEGQLTDDGLTAACLCGLEVDVSITGEGAYVLADGTRL
jgi:hypothetical protein